MATVGIGLESICAVSKATTWGTATNVNKANAGILILSEDFPFANREIVDDESVNNSWQDNYDQGNIDISGSLRGFLRYTGLEFLLAQPMGVAANSAGVTGVRTQRYTYTGNIDGVFGTVVFEKKVEQHEYPSVKFSGFTISGQAGRPLEVTFRGVADTCVISGQKNTSLTTVTYRSKSNRVMFNQLKIRARNKEDAALADAQRINPASFELTYDRPMVGDHVADGGRTIIEPVMDGFPTATLRFTFPRYATAPAGTPGNDFFTAIVNNKPQKIDFLASGPTISGSSPSTVAQFLLDIPNAIPQTVASNIGGPGRIPQEVTFMLKEAAAAPTGMPSQVAGAGGFMMRLRNGVATASLAG